MSQKMLPLALIFLLLGAALSTVAAQSVAIQIPKAVQDSFRKKFPAAGEVHWAQLDQSLVAGFQQNNYYTDAFFRSDGAWLESMTYIDQADLPMAVRQMLQTRYAEVAQYDSVARSETASSQSFLISFEYKGKGIQLRLSPDGKIIEEKKEDL